jgi:hypothetical protein
VVLIEVLVRQRNVCVVDVHCQLSFAQQPLQRNENVTRQEMREHLKISEKVKPFPAEVPRNFIITTLLA